MANETARWVGELSDKLADRLAAVGLIAPRGRATLQQFLDGYINDRADVKPATRTVWRHTRRNLVESFGPKKSLRDITQGDADGWLQHLIREGLSENTVRRRCGIAKQFLWAAVRKKLVCDNPFAHLKSAVSRFGGLRCPSEHLALRWRDVDWERGRVRVTSPKTEHHPEGASREIPLFPELRNPLEELWHTAPPGKMHVVSRYRDGGVNLRTQFLRILDRAGVPPWPKLFQNMRASRLTELLAKHPAHTVAKWMGHSIRVALRHYAQTTDADFERALQDTGEAAQNPAQYSHGTGRTGRQAQKKTPTFAEKYGGLRHCTSVQVGGARLELATSTV